MGLRPLVDQRKSKRSPKRKDFRETYNFATNLLLIDVLDDYRADPFSDPIAHTQPGSEGMPAPPLTEERSIENRTPAGQESLQSFVSHAHAHFLRQHRTHLFQLVLIGQEARFIRWDRAGAAVGQRFNYVAHPEFIAGFLWKFAHMTNSQRGMDATVSLASKQETKLFVDAVRSFCDDMDAGTKNGVPVRQLPQARWTLEDSETWPTWKVSVGEGPEGITTDLIVRRPFMFHTEIFSRGTRAYIAYDIRARRLVFLKDTWRVHNDFVESEFETLQQLEENCVPHVPFALDGGDVCDPNKDSGTVQMTKNDVLLEHFPELWCRPDAMPSTHVHHRVVQEIMYPLDDSVSERDFVQALRDALVAIHHAYQKLNINHRDISAGNVMLSADGRGILIDWENAGRENDGDTWSGTWPFVSVKRGLNPRKQRDLVDDLESIFWVLVYLGLRYYATRPDARSTLVLEEAYWDGQGNTLCGATKVSWIKEGIPQSLSFRSPVFDALVRKANMAWTAAYAAEEALARGHGSFPEINTVQCVHDPVQWIGMFETVLWMFAEMAEAGTEDPGLHPPNASQAPLPVPPLPSPAPNPRSPSPKVYNTRAKRKADEEEDRLQRNGGYGPDCPRRSKRIRTK